jgi:hypothetical protein
MGFTDIDSEDRLVQQTVAERRAETLPPWVARSRFNDFHRLAVNTRIPPSQGGKSIRVGDEVEVMDPCEAA